MRLYNIQANDFRPNGSGIVRWLWFKDTDWTASGVRPNCATRIGSSILIRQNRPKYWSGVSSFDAIKWRSISSIQLRHIICAVRPENLFVEYAHSVEGRNHHRFFRDRRASNYFTVLHCKTRNLVELCAERIRCRCWRIIMNLPKVMRKKTYEICKLPYLELLYAKINVPIFSSSY